MARANAVILLSGGVDSATAAAMAKQQGFDLHALSFRYGQRHERELASAQQVAAFLQAKTRLSEEAGFPCDPSEVHPLLKPHQRASVAWAHTGCAS